MNERTNERMPFIEPVADTIYRYSAGHLTHWSSCPSSVYSYLYMPVIQYQLFYAFFLNYIQLLSINRVLYPAFSFLFVFFKAVLFLATCL
jgi:hypothetical protein